MTIAVEKRQRILAIDFLRGFFLVVILIDHLNYPTYFFEILTGRGSLFASAAEGFFLISGLLVGYLFVAKMRTDPLATTKRLLRRAAVLYGWSIGLTVLFTGLGFLLHGLGGTKSLLWPELQADGSVLSFIWQVLSFQYVYSWADFLPHYVVFMALAPLAAWFIIRGKGWLVSIISIAIWYFYREDFFNAAWQVLFINAMVVGYYLPTIERWWFGLKKAYRVTLLATLGGLTIGTMLYSLFIAVIAPYIAHSPGLFNSINSLAEGSIEVSNRVGEFFDKDSIGTGRLLAATLWFVTTYLFVRTYEKQVLRVTKDFLTAIGSRSLYVYGFQAFVIFFVHIMFQNNTNIPVNIAIISVSVGLTYVAARLYSKLFSLQAKIVGRLFKALSK